jgi:uncharacterized protein (DUF885 family)
LIYASGSMLKRVAIAAALAACVLGGPALGAQGPSQLGLEELFTEYWGWRLAEYPELATVYGYNDHNDRWTDMSRAARDRRRAARDEFLQKTLYFAPGTLNDSQKLSAALLEYQLRTAIEAEPYLDLIQTTSQADGFHNDVFETIDAMPARSVKDYENIIARLRRVPALVDQNIDLLREQMTAGLTQPAIVVTLTLDQVHAQTQPAAADSALLDAFTHFPAAIAPAEQMRLTREATAAYAQAFQPAWRKAESFLRDTYLPKARPQIALTSLPDGKRIYDILIHNFTTTRMTAEQVHQIGVEEVARIEREMQALVQQSGFKGSLRDFERDLSTRPGATFASKDEMLAYARDVAARVQPQLPRLFKQLPRIPFGIRPITPDREAATASNYSRGTPDGTRQAWFNMNTYKPQEQVRYRIEALVLHETIPGHHLQISTALELKGLPEFRKAFGAAAYTEGWGLYAESLGSELGTVYREPATKFGQLTSERFRAVRLVVDTGIHALGWSRQQALDYFAQHVPSESPAEIDRYIARPGQALAYKLGELRIKELRRRAERELGRRFDVREFHDAVLRNGILPLDLLDTQVNAAIASARTP